MPEDGADPLQHRLSTLPQELYDEIYDLTFTPMREDYTITEHWRPSHLLRVDYSSRQKFLNRYFKPTATFTFRGFHYLNFDDHLVRWLRKRNPANLAPTQTVIMVLEGPVRDGGRRSRLEHICRARALMGMAGTHAFAVNHPSQAMVENMRLEVARPRLWGIVESAVSRKQRTPGDDLSGALARFHKADMMGSVEPDERRGRYRSIP